MVKATNTRLWFASSLLLANLLLLLYLGLRPDGLSHIYFFDIGQGDASLVITSDQKTILIDGGPNGSIVSQLATVLPPWERDIDLVILTHPHADHVAGLTAVLNYYQVKEFWFNGSNYDTATYQALRSTLQTQQIPTKVVTAPFDYQLGIADLDIISPWQVVPNPEEPNSTSVVAVLTLGNFKALFTGDADVKSEAEMLNHGVVVDVDVIKVPHQGSRTSSSQEFLTVADPEVGVIMVGADNDYGHPHPEVVQRYTDMGIKLWRTDQNGTVEVITDGVSYKTGTLR